MDAKAAFFVVGSRMKGGMGADETVPFSERSAADKFAAENGGRVMTFVEVPRDYVLATPEAASTTPPAKEVHRNEHAH
jgi:copper chaperone NosL